MLVQVTGKLKLTEKVQILLTFDKIIGRFHFKRLPYGMHSISEVFQKTLSSIIFDIQRSANSQADIVI